MHIAIRASAQQKEEWLQKPIANDIELSWIEKELPEADIYFDLLYEEFNDMFKSITHKPVFVNAVIEIGRQLPQNFIRINAWNGFLQRPIIELSGSNAAVAAQVTDQLGWKYTWAPDEPGMITARIIAMIINEAYFALGDKVSTKDEIDTAMKLGTNYPYGPFEWSRRIGLHRIYRLLKVLSEQDARYAIAPELESELKAIA